mgnify:FL=1
MRTILFHNIVSPYKTLLFNALATMLKGDFEVCYFAQTSVIRDWKVDEDKIRYLYTILNRHKKWEEVSSWKLCLQVFRYSISSRADCFIIGEYSTLPYWAAWTYGVLTGKKLVAIVESQESDRVRVAWKERVKQIFLSKCYRVLVAGEKHKAYVKKLGVHDRNIIVMGGVGGVDHEIYDFYSKKYNTQEKRLALFEELDIPPRKYFIYVGRFSPEKNLAALIRAYADAECQKAGWGLLMVGAGSQEQELRDYAMSLGCEDVVFPGFVQQAQLPLYYLASRIFVLPSLSEPWGLVVDEALALGLPVIVSDRCGCVPDIVHDGENGFVFSPEDETALEQCMKRAMEHQNLSDMGKMSVQISKSYSPEQSARRIANGLE